MSLPNERQSASPATGASARKVDAAVPDAVLPDEDTELELPDSVFRRRNQVTVPPSQPVTDYGAAQPTDLNPPPEDTKEVKERGRKKNPLEKKNAVNLGDSRFTRFVTRPETALAAHVAIENSRSESPVPTEKVGQDNMSFGKMHRSISAAPSYRPNKLFRVLDSIYTHSPLKWLDFIERAGPRLIVGTILALIVAGGVGWIYFESLATDADTASGEKEVRKLTANERVERGKKAVQKLVQELANAQSIDAKLPLVSSPDQAKEKMQKFYSDQQGADPKIVSWSISPPQPGPQGDYLPLTIEDSAGVSTTLVLEETDAGVRIDWENFTAYGESNWQDYCARRMIQPTLMRVRFKKSDRYDGIYTKEKWQAYELEHRSGPPKLTGYVLRSERIAQKFESLCSDDQWHHGNVYLRFETGAGADNLVVIDDLISTRWQDEAVKWTRKE